MKKNENTEQILSFSLPGTKASDLRGRQSVRATFKLTEHAVNAISIVAFHLGIKQKSLFDHLIEDMNTLEVIAREIRSHTYQPPKRVQKTYVLSRKTLSALEHACREYNAPRDAIVEFSIQRLLPVIEREKEKHRRRKKILGEMETFLKNGTSVLEKSHAALGEEDPLTDELRRSVSVVKNAYQRMADMVEKGEIIEEFETE